MKVGDYVRTKDCLNYQLICKINNIIDEDFINTDRGYWDNNHIIKSSPNIIDLIEVGDYVNGCKVDDIRSTHLYCNEDDDEDFCEIILQENIKSIVTREQFEAMQYKVGE